MESSPEYSTHNSEFPIPYSASGGLPDFDEASMSQIPALLELVNLGYEYIPRAKVSELRESNGQYILRDIAFESLRKINPSEISGKSIRDAVFDLEQNIDMGVGAFRASEEIYALLLAGRAVSELIDGRRVSPQMKFIDWKEWKNT